MGTDDTQDMYGTREAHEPIATPDPDPTAVSPEQPLLIVPATQPPDFPGDLAPTVASPMADAHDREVPMPTEIIPVAPVAPPVVHETYAPVYVPPEVPYEEDRRPAWPYIAAVVALLIGGLAGFLIGSAAGDEDETLPTPATSAPPATVAGEPIAGEPTTDATLDMLLARTQADGEYRSPSEFTQLDEITAIDNARATEELQAQVDLLTAAQEDATVLTDQIAELEIALADVTAERDALLIDAGTDTEIQGELDAANATIDELTDDLAEANTDLEAANATIVERDAAITTLQGQLDTANKTLGDLNVKKVPSYVNGDVAKARADAAANRWILIEQPTVSASAPVGVVLDQTPPANSNMITGSVLYLEVAARS